jgi:hypothetical protein
LTQRHNGRLWPAAAQALTFSHDGDLHLVKDASAEHRLRIKVIRPLIAPTISRSVDIVLAFDEVPTYCRSQSDPTWWRAPPRSFPLMSIDAGTGGVGRARK